jgi:hypothetical protein
MKEAEKAKQKEAADRAYKEKLLADERAYNDKKIAEERAWKTDENAKNRAAEISAALAKASGGEKKSIDTSFNGQKYTFKNKDTFLSAMNSIFGIIEDELVDSKGNLNPPYSTTWASYEGKIPNNEIFAIIADIAKDKPNIRSKYGKRINKLLASFTGLSGNPITEEYTASTNASTTTNTTETGKKYKNAQGHVISEEEYNRLSTLVKPLYTAAN